MSKIDTVISKYTFPETGDIYFVTGIADDDPYIQYTRHHYHIDTHTRFAIERLSSGDKCIDVGANIGHFTIPLGKMGIKILAIEALPNNYYLLSKAIQENRLKNVVAIHAAATDHGGVTKMAGTSAWGHLSEGHEGDDGRGIEVPSFRLDDLANIYDFFDAKLVKMDIEGSEVLALSGMERLIKDNKNLEIIFEENTHMSTLIAANYKHRLRAAMQFLQRSGFFIYMFHNNILVPRKPEDFQEQVSADYLATKNTLHNNIGGFKVRQFSTEERIKIVLEQLNYNNLINQAYVCAFIEMAPNEIRNDPRVKESVKNVMLTEDKIFRDSYMRLKAHAQQYQDQHHDQIRGILTPLRKTGGFWRRFWGEIFGRSSVK